ncbi:MAG: tripartite tricarboxylate transporter substrate binding protein [Xanthobacteraceae bacterium]
MKFGKGILVALLSLATVGLAHAQQYPDKAVRIVVPFSAGGPTDVVARVVAEGLSQELKQPFVVENRPGAGGAIATDIVAKAKPDGYTLGVIGTGSFTIIPFMDPKLSYKPSQDLTAVAMLSTLDLMIVAKADSKYKNMKELIAFAKDNPGKLTYATAGVGSTAHLDMENLWNIAGVKALHVAYAGDVPAAQGIMTGDVAIGLISASVSASLVEAGKLKVIAYGGPGRANGFPDALSVEEQTGFKDYVANSWNVLIAPAGTPQDITKKLNEAAMKTLAKPDVQKKLRSNGLTASKGDVKYAVDYVAKDADKRRRVIELIGLKRE